MTHGNRLPAVSRLERLGALADTPFYALVLLSSLLYVVPSMRSAVHETPWLLFALNVFFVAPVCLWVSVLALRSYLAGGIAQILLAGSGVFSFGLANFGAGLFILETQGPNHAVTMHNMGVLASALMHLAGCVLHLRGAEPEESQQGRALKAALGYGGALVFAALVWLGALYDVLPPFVVPGVDITHVRLVVLAAAVLFFAVSALLVRIDYDRRNAEFLRWYGLGLALIALGLLGVALGVPGSLLSWTGRVSQYAGNVYLFAAAWILVRDARRAGLDIEQAVAEFFRRSESHYRALVDASTSAILSAESSGRVILWNRAAEACFGYSVQEAAGMDLVGAIAAPGEAARLRDVVAGGRETRFEATLRRKDGSTFPADLSSSVSGAGRSRAMTFIISDITERRAAEEALREREQELRLVMDTVPALISYIEPGFRYRRVNRGYEKWFGLAARDMEGRRVRDLVGEEAWQIVRPRLERAMAGETVTYEERMPYRAGGRLWVRATLVPDRDVTGRVEGLVALVTDISEHKLAEEKLRQSESRFREMAETVPDILFTALPNGSIDYLNRRGLAYSGMPYDEVMGDGWSKAVHPQDVARSLHAVADSLRTGRPYEVRQRLRAADGSYRWFMVRARAILDEGGGILKWFGTATDINEMVQVQEALVAKHEELQTIFDTVPAWIFYKDRENRFLRVNEAFAGIMEMPRAELEGRSLFDLYPREQADAFWRDDLEVISSGRPKKDIIEVVQTRQGERWVCTDKVPLYDAEGEIAGIIGFSVDITERRRADSVIEEAGKAIARERDILQSVMDGAKNSHLVFLDRDFNFVRVNEAYARSCGYPPQEMVGKNHFDLYPHAENEAIFARVRDTGLPAEFRDKPFVFPDQPERGVTYWDWTLIPIFDDARHVDGLVFSLFETTERRRAEEAISRSEARLRLLSETAGRLLASEEPRGIVNDLCREVMEHLDCQAFFNFMVDESTGRLRLNACAGIPEEEMRKLEWLDYGVAVCGCAARDRVRIVAEDIFHTPDDRTELVKSYGIQAYCCHPLMAGDRLLGTLSFGTKTRARFSLDEIELMRTVADQVSLALERIRYQRALQESEGRYRTLFNEMSEGFALHEIILDEKGEPADYRFLEVNSAFERSTGLRAPEIVGKPVTEVLPGTEPFWIRTYGEVALTGRAMHFQQNSAVLGKDFEVFAYRPAPGRFAVIFLDITERLRAERALRRSEEDLNRAQAVARTGSWRMNVQKNELTWSDENHRIFGVPKGTPMTYEGFLATVHPDDRDYVDRCWMAALRGEPYDIEHRLVVNGEVKWVRETADLEFASDGSLLGGFGTTQDITDRKRAEAQMERLASFPLLNPNPVIEADLEGRITFTNPAAWQLFPDLGKRGPSHPWLEGWEGFAQTLKDGSGKHFREVNVDGRWYHQSLHLVEKGPHLRIYGWDITERKAAEEALRRAKENLEERVRERTAELVALTEDLLNSRDQLRVLASEITMAEEQARKRIAVVLHDEVAQTLAAAKMRLDLLRSGGDDETYRRALTEARELLEQSIRETRALMTDISPPLLFDMGLAAACESLAEKLTARHGIAIRCDISEDFAEVGQELSIVIFQVIRELLANAMKHSGARNVRVAIESRNRHLLVRVTDNGTGFDPKSVQGPTDQGGFGLFSIRERVMAFNGTMTVESNPESGTEVTIALPRDAKESPAGKKRGKSLRGRPPQGRIP